MSKLTPPFFFNLYYILGLIVMFPKKLNFRTSKLSLAYKTKEILLS
ncbi:hypothetical protein EDF66_101401 [Sphingobacterium sp. JUb20]|nr:hypothetical protein [Sphingobacterium sp. JUb21]TCR10587.1 hypothetical protein EDF66_101401 [Sphingobacterium sp. JUb20]